jgi:hypothetical protein
MRYLKKAVFEFGVSRFARQRPTALGVLSTLFGITGHGDLHQLLLTIDSKNFGEVQDPNRAAQKTHVKRAPTKPTPSAPSGLITMPLMAPLHPPCAMHLSRKRRGRSTG